MDYEFPFLTHRFCGGGLKFNKYGRDSASPYDNILDTRGDIVENWYYPIAWYNGSGTQAYEYVTKVFAYIRRLPAPGSTFLHSLPELADPQSLPAFPTTIYEDVPTPALPLATASPYDLVSHGLYTLAILKDRAAHIHRQNTTTLEFQDITAQVLTIGTKTQTLTAQLAVDLRANTSPATVRLQGYASGIPPGTPVTYTFYCNRSDARSDVTPGYAYRSQPTSEGRLEYAGCTFAVPGTYSPKVILESAGQSAQATAPIVIKGGEFAVPDFVLPLPGGKSWALTAEYGTPSHPECMGGVGGLAYDGSIDCNHKGHARYSLDFGARTQAFPDPVANVDVLAAANGVVSCVSGRPATTCPSTRYNGNYVVVDHPNTSDPNKFSTYYLHMADGSIRVSPSQDVSRGAILGRMGDTGEKSEGVHLHFEITFRGEGDPQSSAVLDSVRIEGLRFADFHVGPPSRYAYYPSTNSTTALGMTSLQTTQPAGVAPLNDVGMVASVPMSASANSSFYFPSSSAASAAEMATSAPATLVSIYCDGSNSSRPPDATIANPPTLLEFRPCAYRVSGTYRPKIVITRSDGSSEEVSTTVNVVDPPSGNGRRRSARH